MNICLANRSGYVKVPVVCLGVYVHGQTQMSHFILVKWKLLEELDLLYI
jgi:hypothetical protein